MEAVAIDSSFDDDDCDSVLDSTGISSTVRTGSPMWLPFLLKYNYTIIFKMKEYVWIYIKTKKAQEQDWDGTLATKLNTTST